MSRPTKLPSGRVVFANYDYDWFDNKATEEEKEAFLAYLDELVNAVMTHRAKESPYTFENPPPKSAYTDPETVPYTPPPKDRQWYWNGEHWTLIDAES